MTELTGWGLGGCGVGVGARSGSSQKAAPWESGLSYNLSQEQVMAVPSLNLPATSLLFQEPEQTSPYLTANKRLHT